MLQRVYDDDIDETFGNNHLRLQFPILKVRGTPVRHGARKLEHTTAHAILFYSRPSCESI